jgi:Uma2 family endonuclease
MTALARRPTEQRDPRLWTADQFLEFYKTRPEGERWQLVDGLAIMMVPPSFIHQRIVGNFERALNDALVKTRPELFAYGNVGIRIPGVQDFHPQPDIVVCTANADWSYYQEQYLLVAEVVSPSNTAEMMERKLDLYRSHPDNLYCLTIDQDSIHVVLHTRDGEWKQTDLRSLTEVLSLPAFGFKTPLSALYEGTPLAGGNGRTD